MKSVEQLEAELDLARVEISKLKEQIEESNYWDLQEQKGTEAARKAYPNAAERIWGNK